MEIVSDGVPSPKESRKETRGRKRTHNFCDMEVGSYMPDVKNKTFKYQAQKFVRDNGLKGWKFVCAEMTKEHIEDLIESGVNKDSVDRAKKYVGKLCLWRVA